MKNFYVLLFFALFTQTVLAQETFRFVKIQPESIADTIPSNQISIAPADWAGVVPTQLTAELVFAPVDTSGSRLLCDTPSIDFMDKIVLVDRGECFFYTKALQAQQSGAVGIIIRNFDNEIVNMGPPQDAMEVIDIPVIMIPFDMGIDMEGVMLNDETVVVGFFPELTTKINIIRKDLQMKVYPNPMKDIATFELNGLQVENGAIQLYDVMGRLVKKQSFSQNKFLLERNNLPAGNYFFKISLTSSPIAATGLLQIID